MKRKLLIIILILFSLQLLFRIYQYKDNYLTKFDPGYWNTRYLHSQWVVPNSKESIGDDGLYAHAAWEYIHGKDPSLLNAEIPPFGKYLIGLTEIIFLNQNIFGLLTGIFVLISFYVLNKMIFKDTLLAIIPIILLASDPLFYGQLKAPYLDLLYLGLLLMTFIFIYKEKFLFANILLGLMMATKASSATFILVIITTIGYQLYMKDYQYIKKFLIYIPISIITFLLTYAQYFLLGHNLKEFLGLQKWIVTFYRSGAKGDPSAVWHIIMTGNWPNWFGPVQKVAEWNLLWPLSLIAVIYYFYKVLPRHRQYRSILLGFWIIIYLLFLSIVPVWPRYLLMVLPFMYNLLVWVLSKNMPRLLRRYR